MRIIHLFLGPLVIFLALINGGLGFSLANNAYGTLPYGIIVAIAGLLFIAARVWLAFKRRPGSYRPDREELEAYKVFEPWYGDVRASVQPPSFEMGAEDSVLRG